MTFTTENARQVQLARLQRRLLDVTERWEIARIARRIDRLRRQLKVK